MNPITRLAARAERATSELLLEAAVRVAADRHGLSPAAVWAGRREARRDESTGRVLGRVETGEGLAWKEALYLANTVFNRPVRSIARAAGISPPAVLRAVRAVEGRREDGGVDRRLDELELELRT